eukprot:1799477-Prymnesium_polylepis.1
MRAFAPYSPSARLQFGALSARLGAPDVPEGAHLGLSFAACSLYPPGGLYATPRAPPGRVHVTDSHDWGAPLDRPVWPSRAGHAPDVPHTPSCLLVVDVRCVEYPQREVRGQGWSVLR